MRRAVGLSLMVCLLAAGGLLTSVQAARPPARIAEVEGFRVHHRQEKSFSVHPATRTELEQVLSGIDRMAGNRSLHLPDRYVLFRFPKPVVITASPVGHPVREIIVTHPAGSWDPPRLLIKNGQNQWVEYRSSRPLAPLLDRVKASRDLPRPPAMA